jgi:hypothetical protein
MDSLRDDRVVILAGYLNWMETFFRSNPDVSLRSAHPIDFSDDSARRARQQDERHIRASHVFAPTNRSD